MNDIKKCIDSGLSDMKLSPDFAKRIENSKKPGGTFSGHGYRIR